MPTSPPVGANGVLDARRSLVRALAAEQAEPLVAWLETHTMCQEDLVWLHRQGLVILGFYRLQKAGLLDRLPADVAAQWQNIYQQTTVTTASMDWEIERVMGMLAQANVDFIWMKGAALAYTVYPNPVCRGRGDLDLWIHVEQLSQATALLHSLGYRLSSKEDRPDALALLIGGEQKLVSQGLGLDLIELQWPAIRGEWVRYTTSVDHAGIWQRRLPVALHGQEFCVMAPEDALIHLCLHQAINHQFGTPWLRNLLDVHLLVATYPLEWTQLTTRAADWRVATVLSTVLGLAQHLLDTAVPREFMEALAPPRWQRWLINRLRLDEALVTMRAGGYDHRRFLVQMVLADRVRDAVRLLWRGLFPENAWLQARYGIAPSASMWRLRLSHVWRLATSARA